jgi:hypothetical protein
VSEVANALLNEEVADWFLENRGIRRETLERFSVRSEKRGDGDVAVILPYATGEKTRLGLLGGERRFFFTKGVLPPLYNAGDALKDTVFLVEGETDTMRLWQELHDDKPDSNVGVVGISGVNTWRKELADDIQAKRVFVILDNDADYNVTAQVDAVWREMRHDLGLRARRLRLPGGVKDICEFFDRLDLDTLRLLAKRGAGLAQSRYRPLDLNTEPPPPNWLLDGLVANGDVTLTTGAPGLGKSWFTMGLAVAVVEGHPTFLGQAVLGSSSLGRGRVLYVDQENPDDVVFQRLHALGLTAEGKGRVRYLWNQGIRLDRTPDDFLEEALAYEPTLIVLDSLTRLHGQDENSAGAMAVLFNEGIQPLARETGAAVILIHHDNKAGGPRGSIDIVASADAALHVQSVGEANPGTFSLTQTKSRRRLGGDEMIVGIRDMPDGSVQLVPSVPLEAPF